VAGWTITTTLRISCARRAIGAPTSGGRPDQRLRSRSHSHGSGSWHGDHTRIRCGGAVGPGGSGRPRPAIDFVLGQLVGTLAPHVDMRSATPCLGTRAADVPIRHHAGIHRHQSGIVLHRLIARSGVYDYGPSLSSLRPPAMAHLKGVALLGGVRVRRQNPSRSWMLDVVRSCRRHGVFTGGRGERTRSPPRGSADLEDVRERWPLFASKALSVGLRSVQSVPLRLRGDILGALEQFCSESGGIGDEDQLVVQPMGDVATTGLLHQGKADRAATLANQLQHALHSRTSIEQAKGVISAQSGSSIEASFELLRAHSRGHDHNLSDLARAVVEHPSMPMASAAECIHRSRRRPRPGPRSPHRWVASGDCGGPATDASEATTTWPEPSLPMQQPRKASDTEARVKGRTVDGARPAHGFHLTWRPRTGTCRDSL
jgi:hypothetical protein